eukprot:gene26261-biopygen15365
MNSCHDEGVRVRNRSGRS